MKDDETPPTERAAPTEVQYVDHVGGRRRMVAVPEVGSEECGPDETDTMRIASTGGGHRLTAGTDGEDGAANCVAMSTTANLDERLTAGTDGELSATIRLLSSHPDRAVREAVAASEHTPAAALAASNPNCPPELLAHVASGVGVRLQCLAASHPACPPETLSALAAADDCDVRWCVAANPHTPTPALLTLAASDDLFVLEALADNPASTADVLEHVARLPHRSGRGAAREHPDRPPKFAAPSASPARRHYTRKELSAPGCDPAMLVEAARRPDMFTRDAIAANPNTPADVLRRLSKRSRYAAAAVAGNRSCPADLLAELATHKNAEVRAGAAVNPHLAAATLRALAEDSDSDVRGRAAGSCPAQMLTKLAEDPDPWVRTAVARNRACPAETLDRLAGDTDSGTRRAVARNPNCPPALMQRLAQDPDGQVRAAAAKNSSCPAGTLTRLADDPAPAVRHGVVLNQSCARPQPPPRCQRQIPAGLLHREPNLGTGIGAAVRPCGRTQRVVVSAQRRASRPLRRLRPLAQHLTSRAPAREPVAARRRAGRWHTGRAARRRNNLTGEPRQRAQHATGRVRGLRPTVRSLQEYHRSLRGTA